MFDVLAISGQRSSAKTTLANYLVSRDVYADGSCWDVASFAFHVKRIFCETFNKDLNFIETWKNNPEPPPGMSVPVRQALTSIGNGFRKIKPDIWVELLFRDRDYIHRVIDDARFCNEIRRVKQSNGGTILLYRPGYINFDRNKSESEILPYVLWCEATGRDGEISTWPEFQAAKQERDSIYSETFFENLSLFDYFIRNDGTIDQLHEKGRRYLAWLTERLP